MTVELTLHGERLKHFTDDGWAEMLQLATEYGWQPEEDIDVWCGVVSDRDARTMGEALLRALAALDAREREQPTGWPSDFIRDRRKLAELMLKEGFSIEYWS